MGLATLRHIGGPHPISFISLQGISTSSHLPLPRRWLNLPRPHLVVIIRAWMSRAATQFGINGARLDRVGMGSTVVADFEVSKGVWRAVGWSTIADIDGAPCRLKLEAVFIIFVAAICCWIPQIDFVTFHTTWIIVWSGVVSLGSMHSWTIPTCSQTIIIVLHFYLHCNPPIQNTPTVETTIKLLQWRKMVSQFNYGCFSLHFLQSAAPQIGHPTGLYLRSQDSGRWQWQVWMHQNDKIKALVTWLPMLVNVVIKRHDVYLLLQKSTKDFRHKREHIK